MTQMNRTDEPSKVCTACGKDLVGQPRVKDKQGRYFCLPCDEVEQDKLHGGRAPCAECKRFFRRDKLQQHGTDLVCRDCAKLRQSRYRKMRQAGMDVDRRRAHRIQRIALLVIFLLLAIVALWVWL